MPLHATSFRFDFGKTVTDLEFVATSHSSSNVTSDNTAPGESYKYVILATDLENARVILKNSMNDNTGVPGVYSPLSNMLNSLQGLASAAPYKVRTHENTFKGHLSSS
jgi:hypothetical protein